MATLPSATYRGVDLARSVLVPTLAYHVGGVVGRGAEKEMGRIDTQGEVAVMADEHSIRNRPPSQAPMQCGGRTL